MTAFEAAVKADPSFAMAHALLGGAVFTNADEAYEPAVEARALVAAS